MPCTHVQFCWNERLTRDAERVKEFYADTVGWSYDATETVDGGTYWLAPQDGNPVAGIFPRTSPEFDGVPEGWMSYLAVDDVDARVAKATAAGGKLMRPIFDVPNVRRIAILTEPGGARVG